MNKIIVIIIVAFLMYASTRKTEYDKLVSQKHTVLIMTNQGRVLSFNKNSDSTYYLFVDGKLDSNLKIVKEEDEIVLKDDWSEFTLSFSKGSLINVHHNIFSNKAFNIKAMTIDYKL